MASSNSNLNTKYRIVFNLLLILTGCFFLGGCAGIDLARDSSELTGGYAKAANQQLLLNLARVRNEDPPYFLQVSNISTANTLSSTLAFSPANANTLHPTPTSTWNLGGSLNGTVAQNPTFTFVPLTGDMFSQAISVPMSTDLFYGFIRQREPVDLIARIMLNSITVLGQKLATVTVTKWNDNKPVLDLEGATPLQDKDKNYLNSEGKPGVPGDGKEIEVSLKTSYTLINDPASPTYQNFLIWCYNQRVLQDAELLSVEHARAPDGNSTSDQTYTFKDLKLTDVVTAQAAGYEVTPLGNDSYKLKKNKAPGSASLTVDKEGYDRKKDDKEHPIVLLKYVGDFQTFTEDTVGAEKFGKKEGKGTVPTNQDAKLQLYSLMAIPEKNLQGESSMDQSDIDSALNNPTGVIPNMRTFIGILNGVAKEEPKYDTDKKYNITVSERMKDNAGQFVDKKVAEEVKPILSLKLPSFPSDSSYDLLIWQSYRGTDYGIGDFVPPSDKPLSEKPAFFKQANKSVFKILTLLYADISLNPQKLQQPIQVIP